MLLSQPIVTSPWIVVVGGAAATLLCLSAPAASAPCRISAAKASIPSVEVSPVGVKPFSLRIEKLPLVAIPSSDGHTVLRVSEPLRFTVKSYPTKKLAVRVAKGTSVLGGRLTLAKGLATRYLGVKGRSLQVSPPMHGFSLRHKTVDIPCKVLTLASNSSAYRIRSSGPSLVVSKGRTEHAVPTTYIPLYRTPKKVSPLWVQFSIPLNVIARKPGWIRLQAKWDDGSSVQGWVPNALVEVRLDEPVYGGGGIGGIGGRSGCGRSHPPQLVTFTLRKGSPVHATAGGTAWAHAAKTMKVTAFTISRSDGWVRIAKVDGLPPKQCSEHANMWVHVRDLVWSRPTK